MKTTIASTYNQRISIPRDIGCRGLGAVFGLITVLILLNLDTRAYSAQRPISDFLSRQGHWCFEFDNSGNAVCPGTYGDLGCGFLFDPPSPNFIVWIDPERGTVVTMDYAGLQDAVLGGVLGTSISGSIKERPLADGRAEVEVVLHTKNALTWAYDLDDISLLLFGAHLADVLDGATPSLGNCSLRVKFINPAPGAPLPDLAELFVCHFQDCQVLSFVGQASGLLPDGSPGRLEVTQTGLLTVAGLANEKSRVAADAYPAEHIIIRATGK